MLFTQALSIKHQLTDWYSVSIQQIINGICIAGIAGLVIIGGIKSIAKVTEKIVPFMAVLYVAAALVIIAINYAFIENIFNGF